MQNPMRRISKTMGLDFDADIKNDTKVEKIKEVQRFAKLWIVGFAGFAAIMGNELIEEGGLPTVSVEPDDALSDAIEFGLDTVVAAVTIFPAAFAVAGCAEFVRIHGLASDRIRELQPPEDI